MPKTTPQVKVSQTASHGAEIVLFGEKFDDASAHARQLEKERGRTSVPPLDHPHTPAGQGPVAPELTASAPGLATLRAQARRVGKECFGRFRPRCRRNTKKNKKTNQKQTKQ